MAYNITTLKEDLTGMMHGTTLNQITNLDLLINRAARQLLLDVDPQETKRIVSFANPIFDGVYDYPCPSDLKGNRVIDIRPQAGRQPGDSYTQLYNKTFDVTKSYTNSPTFTINFNTSVKSIRLSSPQLKQGITVNQANTITSNGTWSAGGSASNLENDNVNYVNGGSSLKFNLSAGADPSTGYLENSTFSSVDLSDQEDQGSFFVYVYLPTATAFDNVILDWGSDSSNYWSVTATTTQQGTAFEDGWNLLQFQWLGATETGTPDSSSIGYLKATYTYDGTQQTAVRLNDVQAILGSIMEIEYYSKYLFRNSSTGAYQETVQDDADLVNLDTETYNLLTYQVAILATQQQSGSEGASDSAMFMSLYKANLKEYKNLYKSEVTEPQDTYYKLPNNRFTRWFGNNNRW